MIAPPASPQQLRRALAALALAVPLLLAGAAPAAAGPAAAPRPLADCFGHLGVQFGTFDAYLCEHKLGGDPSGGFYFTKSLDNGVAEANPAGQTFWTKLHPAERNFYVQEIYSDPWGGSTPRSNGRIIVMDEGPRGQCIVAWPDWTKDPATCFLVRDGGAVVEPPHAMDAQELSSALEYQKNARAAMPLSAR